MSKKRREDMWLIPITHAEMHEKGLEISDDMPDPFGVYVTPTDILRRGIVRWIDHDKPDPTACDETISVVRLTAEELKKVCRERDAFEKTVSELQVSHKKLDGQYRSLEQDRADDGEIHRKTIEERDSEIDRIKEENQLLRNDEVKAGRILGNLQEKAKKLQDKVDRLCEEVSNHKNNYAILKGQYDSIKAKQERTEKNRQDTCEALDKVAEKTAHYERRYGNLPKRKQSKRLNRLQLFIRWFFDI